MEDIKFLNKTRSAALLRIFLSGKRKVQYKHNTFIRLSHPVFIIQVKRRYRCFNEEFESIFIYPDPDLMLILEIVNPETDQRWLGYTLMAMQCPFLIFGGQMRRKAYIISMKNIRRSISFKITLNFHMFVNSCFSHFFPSQRLVCDV